MVLCCLFLCLGAPQGSNGSGSGSKTSQRWGHGLKFHPTDWWSRVSNSGPLGTKWVSYPLQHTGICVVVGNFMYAYQQIWHLRRRCSSINIIKTAKYKNIFESEQIKYVPNLSCDSHMSPIWACPWSPTPNNELASDAWQNSFRHLSLSRM